MDKDIQDKLDTHEVKLNAIYVSVERTRKYFLIILWVTVIAVALPVVGFFFVVPSFLDTYSSLNGLL